MSPSIPDQGEAWLKKQLEDLVYEAYTCGLEADKYKPSEAIDKIMAIIAQERAKARREAHQSYGDYSIMKYFAISFEELEEHYRMWIKAFRERQLTVPSPQPEPTEGREK